MTDRSQPGHGSRSVVARALDEALAGVLAPARAREVIDAVQHETGARELPDSSATLRPFARAIVAQVALVAGDEAAELVQAELDAIVRVLARSEAIADGGATSSGSLPREVHRVATARALAPELVLVMTGAPDVAPRLRQLVAGPTRVEVATSAAGLRFQARRARPVRAVIVVDGRTALSSDARVGLAARDAAVGASGRGAGALALVLWGEHARADEWAWTEPDRVVRCSGEVELVDLACLLRHALAKVA